MVCLQKNYVLSQHSRALTLNVCKKRNFYLSPDKVVDLCVEFSS